MPTKTKIIHNQLVFLFMLVFSFSYAQKEISGNWILTKITTNNKVTKPYLLTKFTREGKIIMMEQNFGSWHISKNNIYLDFRKKKFSGNYKIKFDNYKMEFIKEETNFIYQKYHPENNNKLSILGSWRLHDKNQVAFLNILSDNSVYAILIQENGTIETKGTWFYMPKEKKLVVTGFFDDIRGVNQLIKVSDSSFTIKNMDNILQFTRVKQQKLEPLPFKYEDFNVDLDDSNKLPWTDNYLNYLKNIKQINYTKNRYIPKMGVFFKENLIECIDVNPIKKSITFKKMMISKDTTDLESVTKGVLSNSYNRFFPEKDLSPFRVIDKTELIIGKKSLSVTIVEGFDGTTKIKLWMIDKKPGIFAKKMIYRYDDTGKLTHAIIYELKTISHR